MPKTFTVLLWLLVPASSVAQSSPNQPFLLKQLGPGVWATISNPHAKPSAVSNAGFVIGDDGVVVVDSGGGTGKPLLAEIRRLTNLPLKYLINTHYHPDHTAENSVFTGAGATVVAHRNVRRWIHTENLKFFGA